MIRTLTSLASLGLRIATGGTFDIPHVPDFIDIGNLNLPDVGDLHAIHVADLHPGSIADVASIAGAHDIHTMMTEAGGAIVDPVHVADIHDTTGTIPVDAFGHTAGEVGNNLGYSAVATSHADTFAAAHTGAADFKPHHNLFTDPVPGSGQRWLENYSLADPNDFTTDNAHLAGNTFDTTAGGDAYRMEDWGKRFVENGDFAPELPAGTNADFGGVYGGLPTDNYGNGPRDIQGNNPYRNIQGGLGQDIWGNPWTGPH